MLDGTGMIEAHPSKPAEHANPYQSVAWRQTRERLHAAVSELPERQQKIVRYHYFHGLGFDQIGEILGVTKGRISQLHRAALLDLRERIADTQNPLFTG
ncbi:RNA polymerase sigma factor, sigma-70 family protein [Burkholderia cepacia]|uniref:RNA polymerase sigma factor, sigma-70 family protein n=2 Tax=Burkholderia cepacia TaxID=292 RepID=A0AA88Z3Z0_BURCE|nr:RNA polymerase sigma factor, sigma-70 family protein [Burkholderia cepacia]